MPLTRWSERFETGIEVIDAQHRVLFDCLNRLGEVIHAEPSGTALDEGLACMAQRTIKHFQAEETLMKEIGYPARSLHSEQHNELILKVRTLQYKRAKGECVTPEFVAFLAGWFDHHITDSDLDYVKHMKALRHA